MALRGERQSWPINRICWLTGNRQVDKPACERMTDQDGSRGKTTIALAVTLALLANSSSDDTLKSTSHELRISLKSDEG